MCATAATPLVTLIHGVEPPGEPVSNWVGSSGDMVPDLGRWCTAPSPQPGRLRDLRFAILGNGGHVFLASGENERTSRREPMLHGGPACCSRVCSCSRVCRPNERRTKGGSMQREMSFRRGLGVLAAVLMLAGVAAAWPRRKAWIGATIAATTGPGDGPRSRRAKP